jgi:RNA polymerase-interacting CarD/CdnL/TRCF family regulator
MTEAEPIMKSGDWVVHSFCGVGQVRTKEFKSIGGTESDYFRIEMLDSTVWYPADGAEGNSVRPISDLAEFEEALAALDEEPEEMSTNINIRRGQINQVLSENMPISTARMVKDLRARYHLRGTLNQTESQAYRSLCDRFVQEWAVCMDITIEEANRRLQQTLRSDDESGEYFVGPIEKRRIKEQDHLLGILHEPESADSD